MHYAEQNLVIVSTETYSSANKVKFFKVTSDTDFLREYLTAGRQGKYFLFCIWISICRNRTCKFFENRSKINVFMAKMNYRLGFCISRGDNQLL